MGENVTDALDWNSKDWKCGCFYQWLIQITLWFIPLISQLEKMNITVPET